MKYLVVTMVMLIAGCTSGPIKFAAPDKDAPEWDLNVDQPPYTNDLIVPPNVR